MMGFMIGFGVSKFLTHCSISDYKLIPDYCLGSLKNHQTCICCFVLMVLNGIRTFIEW